MTKLEGAIEFFLTEKEALGRSPNTISDYRNNLYRFVAQLNDKQLEEIKSRDISEFFSWLRSYEYDRIGSLEIEPRKLSDKSIRNCWCALSSFFTWAVGEFELKKTPFRLDPPKYTPPPIEPLSKAEIQGLLGTCQKCDRRDGAVILTLLDGAMRVGELIACDVSDFNQVTGELILRKTKNGKPRLTYLGRKTRQALLRYLTHRDARHEESLLMSRKGRRDELCLANPQYKIADVGDCQAFADRCAKL